MAADASRQKVIKFVQELLLEEEDRSAITPALISERIDTVLAMRRSWGEGLDREAAIDELIRRFSLWIGRDATLKNDAGHVDWLNAARKRDWRYWQRYREWLERELSPRAVDALDRSTDSILELLEDPGRDDFWDRRGLVVGHVQSGKTSNYTGLICKAADAGYKIIVVLAGLHNNLRSQTQMRLDEGFLGYETAPQFRDTRIIGVGEIDGDPSIRPNYATNRTNLGDFSIRNARIGISPEQRPWLFVVKKNKTVLERLHGWIHDHVANTTDQQTGRRVVSHLPLLLIDDEADHGSVDTGEQVFDQSGQPDEEHQPTAINRLVRRILHSFSRSAYVGYTATPFANIFIHERAETRDEGPDLFPASFIVNLAAPSNYIGPARIFGSPSDSGRDNALPLVRHVSDFASEDGKTGWMPQRHRSAHQPLYVGKDCLPPSLESAIDAFLLACAARRARGQADRHMSMLIHVTRFNAVQRLVHHQVEEYVRHLAQRLRRGIGQQELLDRLRILWETDFSTTSAILAETCPEAGARTHTWDEIATHLSNTMADLQVRMINGTAKDALDYADSAATGLKVIAIGGDKLARGLTLEGLCTSYFLRASRMYDTLMQMGRWFGYRPGYLDLSRLYTTGDLSEWFEHITDAAEELREEFDLMAASSGTPRDYGLKVQSHPVLLVTSRLKMRSAKSLMLSFSGDVVETTVLHRGGEALRANLLAARTLLYGLPDPVKPQQKRGSTTHRWEGFAWGDVSSVKVANFLSAYRTHPGAHKVNSQLLSEFVRSMSAEGELTAWTVALIGGGTGAAFEVTEGVSVDMLKRKGNPNYDDRYAIGRLLSPRDEALDLDEAAWQAALEQTRTARRADPGRAARDVEPDVPSGLALRKVRGFGAEGVPPHPERGLLLLYLLDPAQSELDLPRETPPIVAFGISFPGSHSGLKVEYRVNNVLWEQEYGSSE
jgi:hypothetical protein